MTTRSLGRYEIRGELGRGSMGVVYRGHDPVIDRPVALKTVSVPEALSESDREQFLKRFFQEARTAGKLLHSNIVVTYDAATDESSGTPFIAMELIDGESLSARLKRDGRLPWEKAVSYVALLARALDHAHKQGIVHRDIKPANVMVTADDVPKVTDFGIAKLPSSAELTKTGVVLGTPYYMSPEQLRGEALDGRSDLFSLGALLYTLVTGKRAFEGAELASIATQVLYKNPRPPSELVPDLPPSLDGVIARALMKSAAERYASGDELATDLEAIREGRGPERAAPMHEGTRASAPVTVEAAPPADMAPPPAPPTLVTTRAPANVPAPRRSDTTRFLIALATLAAAAVAVAVAVVFRDDIGARPSLRDATSAIEAGELVRGEGILEVLVEEHPDFEEASSKLLGVSSEIVRPILPTERIAVHDHRFGDCTGRLVLHDWGVEFSSRSHGEWSWRFDQLVTMDDRGAGRIFLETRENDMMGLLDKKNYNFTIADEPLDPGTWKRYKRLYQQALEDPQS